MTYCNGKGCALRTTCRRWTDGQRIIRNSDGDTDQHRFIDHCDIEHYGPLSKYARPYLAY